MQYIFITYFSKLLKLNFFWQYILHFLHSNKIRGIFVNKNYFYYYYIHLFIYILEFSLSIFLLSCNVVVFYAHDFSCKGVFNANIMMFQLSQIALR